MTADQFVKIVRNGADKLRVDDVIITGDNKTFKGKGMLEITPESFKLHIRLIRDGQNLPIGKSGIYTKKDNWQLTGLIDDTLQFKCDQIYPLFGGDLQHLMTKFTIRLHPVDLIPSGVDTLTHSEREALIKEHQTDFKQDTLETAPIVTQDELQNDFCFYATLYEYPLLTSNWSDEVKGETQYFDYAIKTIERTSDLRISLKSKKTVNSCGTQQDWKKFYSFMNTIAFITGINAWPYRIEYWCNGKQITDKITPAHKLSSSHHVAFSDTLAFNSRTGSIKWSIQETIKTISRFYDTESNLTEEISYLHYLFRQSTNERVHGDITILALCILFENLVRQIFEGLGLDKVAKIKNPIFEQFESAKRNFLEKFDINSPSLDGGHKRLIKSIQSAEPFNVKSMLEAIADHFGLKWQGDIKVLYNTWQSARNPLIHRGGYANRSEDDLKGVRIAESHIAGAINMLSLKLFGYSGPMQCSAFEEKHRQI